jgi:hypothetical protein
MLPTRVLVLLFLLLLLNTSLIEGVKSSKKTTRPGTKKKKKVNSNPNSIRTSKSKRHFSGKSSKKRFEEDESDEEDYADSHARGKERVPVKAVAIEQQSVLNSGIGTLSSIAEGAFKLGKYSVKGTVDLLAAKHVSLKQILGNWRLAQEVEVGKGNIVHCPATIEFREDNIVVTHFEGEEYESEFVFKENAWPKACRISFEAKAFQGPGDNEPARMLYKGYFKRSLMKSDVIFIRGSMYKLSGKMFWKSAKKCGKFKATLRRYKRRD